MTLSEELQWRGFVNQTTYKDVGVIDQGSINFYFGVDPSAKSMTVGNLAATMMARHFIDHGHQAFLLVGGATGMIGDPDGKAEERELKSLEEITAFKAAIAEEYKMIFGGQQFELVDNYSWFKDIKYLDFLRDIGKHVPMRQMLGRDFVQQRLKDGGAGISYGEFSYVLIQAYDFLYLSREKDVSLQICGSDQWGNSIAGVDLIRRLDGKEAHVWSAPLVINRATGKKFGKSEDGAVWLNPEMTSPYKFYQFWLNVDDEGVEEYLKIYTLLNKEEITAVKQEFQENRAARIAQKTLAYEVTKLVHGQAQADKQKNIAEALFSSQGFSELSENELTILREELPHVEASTGQSIVEVLVDSGLASSNSEARQFINGGGVYINNIPQAKDVLEASDFINGRLLIRKGKVLKNTALVELK